MTIMIRRFEHVVVATDFSGGAGAAVTRVRGLALSRTPRLHLVHVIPLPTLTPQRVAEDLARTELAKTVAALKRRMPRARVTGEVTSGRPADEIVRIARQRSAQLIVLGRRGAGGFPRLLLGSTAERLMRLSPLPVLTVAPRSRKYSRALFAVDVTERTAALVETGTGLLPARAAIELLNVYLVFGEGYLRLGGATSAMIARHRRMVRDQASEAIAPIADAMSRAGFSVTTSLGDGDPRFLVPRFIRRKKPSLVVIGNHARNVVSRALLGSVAMEVLRHAKCDVLLVPI